MRLGAEPLWALSLYPEAGEGGGCLLVARGGRCPGGPPDPERAAAEAARRARAKIRRYCGREPAEPARHADLRGRGLPRSGAAAADLAAFFRGLRDGLGGARSVSVGAAVASGRARPARALRGRPLRPAAADRAGLGSRVRAHQAARRAAGRLGRAREARLAARYLAAVRRPRLATTSAGRRGCTATRSRRASSRRGRVLRPLGRGRDRARLAATWERRRSGSGCRRRWRGGMGRPPAGRSGLKI